MTTSQPQLHFEKGQPYLGTDTTVPCDMTKPEFAGLEEVIRAKNITSGDYRWDRATQELIPASGGRV